MSVSEKTVRYRFDVGENGENAGRIVDDLRRLAEMGFHVAHGGVQNVSTISPLEAIGRDVIPAVAACNRGPRVRRECRAGRL